MGSDAHVVVAGDAGLLDRAEARIEELEARWSRFRLDSEVSILNRANGVPTIVSRDTVLLLTRSLEAWRATDGAFDPTVHDAVVDLGYDRDFRLLPVGAGRAPAVSRARPAPGLADVVVDPPTGMVWLPEGVHLDPGAIGKGLAADLVANDLVAAGARGACVALGGDVRVAGSPDDRDAWSVTVPDPHHPERELARIDLADGGVATSSRLRRRWSCGGVEVHHVVDPRTGWCASSRFVAASVVARDAWWAEVRATEALVTPDPLGRAHDVEILAVDEHGEVHATPLFGKVLTCSRT
jgi:thiamine biosynthesis lipoprotein